MEGIFNVLLKILFYEYVAGICFSVTDLFWKDGLSMLQTMLVL